VVEVRNQVKIYKKVQKNEEKGVGRLEIEKGRKIFFFNQQRKRCR